MRWKKFRGAVLELSFSTTLDSFGVVLDTDDTVLLLGVEKALSENKLFSKELPIGEFIKESSSMASRAGLNLGLMSKGFGVASSGLGCVVLLGL